MATGWKGTATLDSYGFPCLRKTFCFVNNKRNFCLFFPETFFREFVRLLWGPRMNTMTGDYSPFDGHMRLLRPATLAKLSYMLNPKKVIPTDDGHLR